MLQSVETMQGEEDTQLLKELAEHARRNHQLGNQFQRS